MGNFSSIKDAIFGSEAQAQEAPPATSTPGSGGFSRADTKGEAISEVFKLVIAAIVDDFALQAAEND